MKLSDVLKNKNNITITQSESMMAQIGTNNKALWIKYNIRENGKIIFAVYFSQDMSSYALFINGQKQDVEPRVFNSILNEVIDLYDAYQERLTKSVGAMQRAAEINAKKQEIYKKLINTNQRKLK